MHNTYEKNIINIKLLLKTVKIGNKKYALKIQLCIFILKNEFVSDMKNNFYKWYNKILTLNDWMIAHFGLLNKHVVVCMLNLQFLTAPRWQAMWIWYFCLMQQFHVNCSNFYIEDLMSWCNPILVYSIWSFNNRILSEIDLE